MMCNAPFFSEEQILLNFGCHPSDSLICCKKPTLSQAIIAPCIAFALPYKICVIPSKCFIGLQYYIFFFIATGNFLIVNTLVNNIILHKYFIRFDDNNSSNGADRSWLGKPNAFVSPSG